MLSKKDVGSDGVIYEATYTYDASGNIVSLTSANSLSALDFEETEMEYDSANRLIKWNGFSLVYDADGNMTYGPLNGKMESYVYDCRNRLVRAGDTSYTYDAENNRIGVFTPKEKTTYVVDSSSSLTQILLSVTYLSQAADGVYSETGTQTKYYYGNGLTAQSDSKNGYLTYHFDHLGSTAALTDISGKTVSRYAYGTYGELAQGDTQLTRFLYNGQYGVVTDANGLYQMRARYYSPDLKRFVNQDVLLGAITNSQSLNRYAYTNGNPINRLDPFGLCAAMLKNMGHLALIFCPRSCSLLRLLFWGPYWRGSMQSGTSMTETSSADSAVWESYLADYLHATLHQARISPLVKSPTFLVIEPSDSIYMPADKISAFFELQLDTPKIRIG